MSSKIVCFGEILWDVFPDGERIGGAPLNVAQRLSSFGNDVTIISAVGDDNYGKQLLNFLTNKNLSTRFIQISKEATSLVKVSLDINKSASYEIVYPCAWDFIHRNDQQIEIVKNAKVFVYGSLIARNKTSRKTLLDLLAYATYKVFDVNLRPPHYQMEDLVTFMKYANFIKFNDEEIIEIGNYLNLDTSHLESLVVSMSEKTQTDTICVTLGKNGALLYSNKQFYSSKGFPARVVDTVGAGDSFLGTLIDQLQHNHPQKALEYACAVGAIVTQHKGANPEISHQEILNLLN